MIDYVYENNFLDSSRETGKAAILKRRQTRGILTKSLEIYAVFDVKKRASRLITLSGLFKLAYIYFDLQLSRTL